MSKAYPCRSTFWQSHKGGFYFRIRGWGFAFDTDMPILFSERAGYHYVLRIGRYAFQLLTPHN